MSEVIDIAENILCVDLEKLRATLAVSGQGKLLQMQHSKTAEKQQQQSSLPTNVLHCIRGWGCRDQPFSSEARDTRNSLRCFMSTVSPGLQMQAWCAMNEYNETSSMKREPEKSQAKDLCITQCQDMFPQKGKGI